MTEINSLRSASRTVLRDIAKQAHGLATGLQNAAPPQEGGQNKSVLYLAEIATMLQEQIRMLDSSHDE